MDVKKIIETKEGPVEVSLTLSDEEHQFVLEIGLNVLYAHGSVLFLSSEIDPANIMKAPKAAQ